MEIAEDRPHAARKGPIRRWPGILFACLLCGGIGAALAAWASAPWPALTPDSTKYLNAGRNLLDQGDLSLTVTPINQSCHATSFAAWPPGYPLAIAAAMHVVADPPAAARLVQLLSIVCLALPLALLADRIAGRRSVLPVLAIVAILRPQLLIASFAWSEALFILWTYSCLSLLVAGLQTDGQIRSPSALHLFIAGIFAGLAMLTRYLGVVVIATGVLVLIMDLGQEPSVRRSLSRIGLFAGPALLPNLAWLIRNRMEVGFFFGEARTASLASPQIVLLDALRTIWTDTVMPPITSDFVPRIALGLLGLLSFAFLIGVALNTYGPASYGRTSGRRPAVNTLVTFTLLYVLTMVFISICFTRDPMNTRLFAPIYPAVLLLGAFLLRPILTGDSNRKRRGLRPIVVLCIVALACLQAAAAYRYLCGPREDRSLTAPYWRSTAFADPSWRNDATIQELVAIAPRGTLVLTNLSDVVSLWTDRPTKSLPDRNDPDLEEKIAVHRRAVVLVHRQYRQPLAGVDELDAMVQDGRCWFLGRKGEGYFYRVRG
jgi:4-amino-4-deoxy-L-arabinose transferase-like glycosyltransferase